MTNQPNLGLHPVVENQTYAMVVLPLALPQVYTYLVPEEHLDETQFGVRVEVQFGKHKLYSGLVVELVQTLPGNMTPKPILSVIDTHPIITQEQYQFWKWLANYYSCTLGEVMNAALPANLKLISETMLTLSPLFDETSDTLNNKEYIIIEALRHREELSVAQVRDLLKQKTVYGLIKQLLDRQLIYLKEEFKEKYKPKKISCVRLQEAYRPEDESLRVAFELVQRSARQTAALMAYLQLVRHQDLVRKQDIYNATEKVDSTVLNALVKKGIFEYYDRSVSRIADYEDELLDKHTLSEQQSRALTEIKAAFEEKEAVLLHGVTGSGKTRVYIELIQEALARGEQVLYLLPEIALTTQIIMRLQRIFGSEISVYHSRLNNNERVELWEQTKLGKPIILGARSGLFLPFMNLKLIIIDEEHDPSFKQNDPNPRYQGRDAAVYMARIYGAKVLLGTATPSVESYQNAQTQKYALVKMPERFGGLALPEVVVVDLKDELKKKTMKSIFSSVLLTELEAALERGEQAILFQNRRGYAPTLHCQTCGWHQECTHCDVSLTYHKYFNKLKCHYCGFSINIPEACPACGVVGLSMKGFGTEKIENELKIFLPKARIARMDLETARSKQALGQLINDFEEQRLDILVGTQMVTKGLDFDNVSIVGILSADQMLQFPDFRASERAFQLMTQVSGRAGRKRKQGKVIIQAFNTGHPVLKEVVENNFLSSFERELVERQEFGYPPFIRLIRITLKHKKPETLNAAGKQFEDAIKTYLGHRVIGPAVPHVGRVRSFYILDFLIKLERNAKQIRHAKNVIQRATQQLRTSKGFSGVRVNVDVDPM